MTDVEAFLSHLAEQRSCSTNTQGIALNALVYLHKRFMGLDIGDLAIKPAQGVRRISVVYSREEITATLSNLRVTGGRNCCLHG
jgi:hypothetical protein